MRIVVALLLCAACGEGVPEESSFAPRFSEVQSFVFVEQGCAACHQGASTRPGLSLQPFDSHASLVGRAPRSPAWDATPWRDWKLVEPGAPERSLLVVVLEQPDALPSSLRMPGESQRLSQARVDAVREWIRRGALDD